VSRLQRGAVWCVVAVPLVVDPLGHDRYGPLRWLVAAAALAVVLVVEARSGRLAVDRRAGTGWLVVLVVAGLASLVARDQVLALWGDPVRLGGLTSWVLLAAAFAAGCGTGRQGLGVVAAGVAVAGTAAAAAGLARLALDGGGRAVGLAGNAAYLGAALAVALPVTVALGRAARGRMQIATWAAAVVVAVGLVASGTRGAWLGAAAGVAIVVTADAARRTRVVACALVVGVVVLSLVVPLGARAPGGLDLSRGTARGRLDTWAVAARAVADRPALGWGPDGTRVGLEEHVDRTWVRRYGLEQLPDRAHDMVLDVAVALGVPGVLAWSALVGAVLVGGRRRLRAASSVPERRLVLGALGGLVAYGVQGLFFFETFDTGVVAWLLAGALVVGGPAWSVPRRAGTALVAVVSSGLLVAGAAGVLADHRAREALDRRQATAVVDGLRAAARLRPRARDLMLLAAGRAGRDPVALRAAHRLLAPSTDPDVVLADADVLVRLARTGTRGAQDAAVSRYRAVLSSQPVNGLAWLGLGEAEALAGRQTDARVALTRARDLLPRSPYPALDLGLLELARGDAAAACRWARAVGGTGPARDALVRDLRARIGSC
jgi:O-antigen ligase/Flp pilus assembly protein TadD